MQKDHLILARRPDLVFVHKKDNLQNSAVIPADHRVKLKESEKGDKFPNFAWELKTQRSIKVTVIQL